MLNIKAVLFCRNILCHRILENILIICVFVFLCQLCVFFLMHLSKHFIHLLPIIVDLRKVDPCLFWNSVEVYRTSSLQISLDRKFIICSQDCLSASGCNTLDISQLFIVLLNLVFKFLGILSIGCDCCLLFPVIHKLLHFLNVLILHQFI